MNILSKPSPAPDLPPRIRHAPRLLADRLGAEGMGDQLIRYVLVGLASNAALYVVYLILTHTVLQSRPAMTVVYAAGVGIGFFANRRITFRYGGRSGRAMLRYLAAYLLGYVIDWTGLWLLVEHGGLPHELVQLFLAGLVAVLLFVLQRQWVFPSAPARP